MKRAIIIAALLASGSALADWVVKATAGNPAVVSVTGGSVDKVSSTPPATPWTPTWAISACLTNTAEYADSGVAVGSNYTVNLLINIRSNTTATRFIGSYAASTARFAFGTSSAQKFHMYYGNSSGIQVFTNTSGVSPLGNAGWLFVTIATSNTMAYISTNNVAAGTMGAATSFAAGLTNTFRIGTATASTAPFWDIARIQLINPSGTVEKDFIATGVGTFTNCSDASTITWGVGGTGGTSLDSTNVTGQTYPPMNWAAGGGAP
jgi:hypothetical protein